VSRAEEEGWSDYQNQEPVPKAEAGERLVASANYIKRKVFSF
jgi:hypothetical protein